MNANRYCLDRKESKKYLFHIVTWLSAILITVQLYLHVFPFDLDNFLSSKNLFAFFALVCSFGIGLRFWNIYFGLPIKREERWQLYGIYCEKIRWSNTFEMVLDYCILFIGGFLVSFSIVTVCPQLWLLTAIVLFALATIRHTTALHNKALKKNDKSELENIYIFLRQKRKATAFYFIFFLVGFFISLKPYLVTHNILEPIINNPESVIVAYIFGLFLLLVLRVTSGLKMRDNIKMFINKMKRGK